MYVVCICMCVCMYALFEALFMKDIMEIKDFLSAQKHICCGIIVTQNKLPDMINSTYGADASVVVQ